MNGLRNTLEKIQKIVKNVPNVKEVFIGDIYDNLNANESVCYPAGVVYQNGNRIDFTNHRIYTTVNIFLCDRETDDKSNKLSVQTWATNALYFIAKELQKAKFYIPQETLQVKTFEERFGAVAAGAYLTCEVFTPMSECETLEYGITEAPPESSIKGLQFKAVIDDMDIYLRQIGSFTHYPPLVYTFDGRYWLDWDYRNDEPIHVKEGHSVWIKSKTQFNRAISGWSTSYRNFDFVGNGLVMAYQYIDYLHGENFIDTIYTGDYAQLFKNATKLVKAPDIYSTIKNDTVNLYYQCQDMFSGCTGLIYGPKELKCDMPKSYMWRRMFNGCVALLKTPHIVIGNQTPTSDSQGNYMCSQMFDGCTGLREIDMEIKYEDVNTTAQYEFSYMFRNCTNLTDASNFNFPMKTLNIHMLRQCFDGCTSLVKAPEILCTELRQGSTTTGGACNLYYMFNNCTSLEDGPTQILSEVIPYQGCQNMFYGCTKLKNAPYLNAKTIHQNGCTAMFYNCQALTNDTVQDVFDFNYIGISGCQQMFQSCKGLTTAPEINVLELGGASALNQTFYQCTGITDCQEILNPMTLTTNCYYQMYDGCTNLTKSPELPATTSVSGCYNYMFRNTKVNRIKCLLNPAASQSNWVLGVSGTIRDGLFIKHPNATWPAAGVSSVPVGWTIINDGEPEPNLAPQRMLMKSSRNNSRNILDELDTEWLTFLTENRLEDEYVKYIEERES